jgi:hypothetical protein
VNELGDQYHCTVETECLIRVESIVEAAKSFAEKQIFQEELCARLAKAIGGDATVTLVGSHSGVITTVTCRADEA